MLESKRTRVAVLQISGVVATALLVVSNRIVLTRTDMAAKSAALSCAHLSGFALAGNAALLIRQQYQQYRGSGYFV